MLRYLTQENRHDGGDVNLPSAVFHKLVRSCGSMSDSMSSEAARSKVFVASQRCSRATYSAIILAFKREVSSEYFFFSTSFRKTSPHTGICRSP